MKIAVDKNSVNFIKKDKNEYIYLFDDEPLETLLKINLPCLYYKKCGMFIVI